MDHFIYHLILENKIADQYPVATTKLVFHLVEFFDKPTYDYGSTLKISKKLVTMPETHVILSKVADKLAEKGSTLASKIKEQIIAKKETVDS
jgi:hypothetical protein